MDFWLSASVVVTFLDCNQFVSTLKNCNRNPILDFDPKFPEIVGIGCDWGELSGYLKKFPEIPSLKKKNTTPKVDLDPAGSVCRIS